jgi:hypothetical protein
VDSFPEVPDPRVSRLMIAAAWVAWVAVVALIVARGVAA